MTRGIREVSVFDASDVLRLPGPFFAPLDAEEHELGNQGYDVDDLCRHCGAGFLFHVNGRCPVSR
jgi:hypothetical protein